MKKVTLDAYDLPAFVSGTNTYYDITEGKCIYHKIIKETNLTWTHLNIWGCPYEMKADQNRVAVYWIEEEGQYKRVILPYFINLQYDGGFGYRKVNMTWGNPDVIEVSDNAVTLNYGYCDKVFKDRDSLESDIINPSEFDFTPFCNEIFGDG